jgi:hypothetical protein
MGTFVHIDLLVSTQKRNEVEVSREAEENSCRYNAGLNI